MVNTWLMLLPEPALAPVILPVMVPTIQVNVLGALAVRAILVLSPLQEEAVFAVVTTGVGLTVIVIVNTGPVQLPLVETGVTRYWTVPADVLLGLVSNWLMVAPEPALAPVIPPVIAPIVQEKLLGAVAERGILGPMPLQVE